MRVLRVEERHRRIDLLAVRLHEILDLYVAPVGADDRVALDALHPDRLELLVEELFPHAGAVPLEADGVGLLQFGMLLVQVGVRLPVPAVDVVVAVDEQLLHGTPIRRLAVRECLVPAVRADLQLRGPAGVRDVAGDQHAVRAVVAEVGERLEERGLVAGILDVDVAQDSDF